MAAVIGVVPVLTPVCMSLLFLVDWTFVLLVISLAVSFLIEPYTVNPISRFAFQLVDFGERALGPLAERIEASWLKRLAVGAAAVILDAAVAAGLLVLLAWVSGSAPTDLGAFGVGLRSALSLAVEYGFWFFILVVIIGALMSWFSPDPQNPLVRFVSAVSYPLIAPFRRYIPPIAGIDISPIFVILLLGAAQSVLLRLIWRMF
jgi:YggT family protein